MGLQDYSYRLKAQSGDSTPHDELGVTGDLSGGTISLVDRGGGDYVWQFIGKASVAGPSKTISAETEGGGATIAFRMAVTNFGMTDYSGIAGYAPTGTTDGMRARDYGDPDIRFRWDLGLDILPEASVGTAIRTYVMRIHATPTSSGDSFDVWIDKVGRSGTAPNASDSGINISSKTLAEIFAGATGGTVQISDFVIWPEELSDADCAALADDGIRATLDSAAVTVTLTPDPASVQVGSARTFTATRSAPAGAGGVTYNVSSDNPAVATVPTPQTLTEADSDLTFDATGVSVGTANITITNAADSSETDTVALTVTAVTTKKAKFLVHPDFASATGITIEVNEAPTGGALTGAKLGFTTGVAAEATLEGGQAVIKVNAADVGASALAAATSVVAIFKGTTSASSPLGNAVEGGSVATAAGTIIEE